MPYRAFHLAGFVLMALLLTAVALLGVRYIIEPILADPRAVHEFFLDRSWIQWMTLAVFFFVLSVLVPQPS